jgi:long-chain acyl-CoA synthetase
MIKMKDYSNWKAEFDYENNSPWVEPTRPWLKYRNAAVPKRPKTVKYDPIPLHEFIKLQARKCLNNVCAYYKPTGKNYTYRDLIYYADKIANALYDMGISKGDSVGLYTHNTPEFIFCFVGILSTGAAAVPINPLLKKSDVVHITKESGNMKAIFVHEKLFSEVKKGLDEVNYQKIIVIGKSNAPNGTISYDDFIKDKAAKAPDVEIDPMEDLAVLLFTGGTMGLPKGVMLTHNNLISIIASSTIAGQFILGKLTALSILPMCHSYGLMVMNVCLILCIQLIIMPFNAEDVLEAIEFYKLITLTGVPIMFQMIVNSPDFTERDLSSLNSASSGSAALPPEIAKKFKARTGLTISQGFGLTESSPATHSSADYMPEVKIDSIGVPILNTDSIIVDPITLEEKPIGEIGELLVRGPQIMKGYWRQPEASARILIKDKEGKIWLRTGDLARMNEDGYFFIEGRSKEMIKVKSYKVMPLEVEKKLFEHPGILEAGVIGIPNPNTGEEIKAFVVLQPEFRGKLTEREIIDWATERMAKYKIPRKIEFLDELPRTSVGKIFRRKLLEMELKNQTE